MRELQTFSKEDADRIRDATSDRLQRRYASHPAGLIKRPIGSWPNCLTPEFKGKARDPQHSSIGIMDAAIVSRPAGQPNMRTKGNMTKAE